MIQPASSTLRRSPWLVGRDKDGHWVVRDPAGLNGGIFVNRTAGIPEPRLRRAFRAAVGLKRGPGAEDRKGAR
jgi:hypothetical protein